MVPLIEEDLVLVDQDFNNNKMEVILKIIINKMIIILPNKDNEVEVVFEVVIAVVIVVVIVEMIEIINNTSMNNSHKIQMSILHHRQIRLIVVMMHHMQIDVVVVVDSNNGMLVIGMVKQ
jgi:hypothetical protein